MSGNMTDDQVKDFEGVFNYFGPLGDSPIEPE